MQRHGVGVLDLCHSGSHMMILRILWYVKKDRWNQGQWKLEYVRNHHYAMLFQKTDSCLAKLLPSIEKRKIKKLLWSPVFKVSYLANIFFSILTVSIV